MKAEPSSRIEWWMAKRSQKAELGQPAVMLSPILPGGAIEFQIEAQRSVRGTRSAVVNRPRFGKENHAVARLAEAVTPIHIFPVHEKLRDRAGRRVRWRCGEPRRTSRSEPLLARSSDGRSRTSAGRRTSARFLEQRIEAQSAAEIVPDGRKAHGRAPYFARRRPASSAPPSPRPRVRHRYSIMGEMQSSRNFTSEFTRQT